MRLFKPNIPKMLAKKDLHGLVKALGDDDPRIVWDAAGALGDLKDPRAGDLLLEAVHKPASRVGAIAALGFTSNVQGYTPMIAALRDSDANVRRAAAFALPMIALLPAMDPLVAEPLAGALEDENSQQPDQPERFSFVQTEDQTDQAQYTQDFLEKLAAQVEE